MISIILPTYNEAKNIAILIPLITEQLSSIKHELIVVDDNSPDGTAKVVRKLQRKGYPVRVFVRKHERGLASATVFGFKQAKYKLISVMDTDLQHNPKYLPQMINEITTTDIDMVVGSRYLKDSAFDKWPIHKKLLSKVGILLTRPLTKIKDPLTQFYIVRKDIVNNVSFLKSGFRTSLEILADRNVTNVTEVPIIFTNRIHGESKIDFKGAVRDLVVLLKLYRKRFLSNSLILKTKSLLSN